MHVVGEIAGVLATFIEFYTYLLIARVLLSWIPSIDWMSQPFAALNQITEPYLSIFRSIIPSLGGFDFSPILGFILLNILSRSLFVVQASYPASLYGL